MKFYRGSPGAARSYVEADRSRVDDYYLAEGTGVATRYVAEATAPGEGAGGHEGGRPDAVVRNGGTLDGDAYERWVGGYDVETDRPKGRLRTDEHALRFVEVVINGPKTWSLAAALHPPLAEIGAQLGHADLNVTARYLGRTTAPTRAASIMVLDDAMPLQSGE